MCKNTWRVKKTSQRTLLGRHGSTFESSRCGASRMPGHCRALPPAGHLDCAWSSNEDGRPEGNGLAWQAVENEACFVHAVICGGWLGER